MGNLYIVSTPIGNLEDITLRALRVLRDVSLIAAEDTRTTRRLLTHFDIKTPLTSYHEHNKLSKLDGILSALQAGDVALVSDAGTPGLSDPGYELIRAAIDHAVPVIPLPGPSALLPALVASGLPTDSFLYLGFLPRKSSARRAVLQTVAGLPYTLVCYEAPHRLLDTLADVSAVLGMRPITVARELTKLYEQIWRGSVDEALEAFGQSEPRGEFTLVIAGALPQSEAVWTEEQVRQALAMRLAAGEPRSIAAKAIAEEAGWPRRAVYNLDVE
ncbi:MAG: 16S rRNA (cytidine(1402)-2'-O)-methyltransferase [Anaerolineae bacterium]|nr:16S rRNA (cytidine(1402)-2'-O)-methyltransferase [Anaerolineae bacterium]